MLEELWEPVRLLLGLDRDVGDVNLGQMALRTVIVYAVTLVLIRLGNKRFLSRATAFDVIVAIMLGSIVSRAINGSAPFVPTLLGAGVALVGMHWLFGTLAFHTDWLGAWIKGEPVLLIREGQLQEDAMRSSSLSERDLIERFRLQGHQPDLSKIQCAYLERSGEISLIPYPSDPRVIEVPVTSGVQTVRIELG